MRPCEYLRAPGHGLAGLMCARSVRAQGHACGPPAPGSLCWKSHEAEASAPGVFWLTERRPGMPCAKAVCKVLGRLLGLLTGDSPSPQGADVALGRGDPP